MKWMSWARFGLVTSMVLAALVIGAISAHSIREERAALRDEQKEVAGVLTSAALNVDSDEMVPTSLAAIPLEETDTENLCSWLGPESRSAGTEEDYGAFTSVPYFVHAFIPRRNATPEQRICFTTTDSHELLPAVYLVVHAPFPSIASPTYLRFTVADATDSLHFGAKIERSDSGARPQLKVAVYELEDPSQYFGSEHVHDEWLKTWVHARPAASPPLKNALVRLRLRPPPESDLSVEDRFKKLREFAARDWSIDAVFRNGSEISPGVAFEARKRPFTDDELLNAAVARMDRDCVEMRRNDGAWRSSSACQQWPSAFDLVQALVAPFVTETFKSDRVTLVPASDALELRFPREVLIRRLADHVRGFVVFTGASLGLSLGVWFYLRTGLGRRVAKLSKVAVSGEKVRSVRGDNADLLQPLVDVILRERQQRAELQVEHEMAREHARAFHSTATAFRHELSDFVGAAVLLLEAGELSEDDQGHLLKNAKLAHLIIRKIEHIRGRKPLQSLPEELHNISPEWVSLQSIYSWWSRQVDRSQQARIRVRGDLTPTVWAALGPVIWIMARFVENAFRHGIAGEYGTPHLRIGTRRLRSGFVAITFANRTCNFDEDDIDALFDVNRESIRRESRASSEDLSGVGLYAARQYALLTEGMVGCRYRPGCGARGVVSFTLALKGRADP